MQFYLIGIKGAAMSALAKILYKLGHIVLGVDNDDNYYTISDNCEIKIESFSKMNLNKTYYYVIGNAYLDHSVTNYIKNMGYYYKTYPTFLVSFFKEKKWLCVCGTHGKTTTSKLLTTFLNNSTSLIGDGSCSVGTNDLFILESCEYKDTFLNYKPNISLVLNVDYDHVDYFKHKSDYDKSFIKFINSSKLSIVNGDEFYYRNDNTITYGMNDNNDVKFAYSNGKVTILKKIFYLPIKGEKYAYDFVGAYLVAKLLNVKDYEIQLRLNKFKMPKRRFYKTIKDNQIVILDYAHHPNEIKAIKQAIEEEYPNKKIICVFEPHTISRLEVFLFDFKHVLDSFDDCYLYNLFSSIRENHNQVLEKKLYSFLEYKYYNEYNINNIKKIDNCVVCFLGAGVIDKAYFKYIN